MNSILKLVCLIAFGSIVVFACKNKKTETPPTPQFVLSDTMITTTQMAVSKLSHLKNELKFYGKIAADNNKLIEVYPVVGGNVINVNVELGDYVQKDQLLATIRSPEVAGFEKELQDAKNDVLIATNNVKVTKELFDGKLNAERDILEANSRLEKAKSQLARIEETYRIYHLKMGSIYEVRSPLSGFVIQKNINKDMQLRSDRSDNIFDIAQIEDVWAIANINESDIGQVKIGESATVTTLSYPGMEFHGKVDKIFNIIDPDTKAMKVRIILKNNDYLLKPEMRASIRVNYTEGESMIALPSAAVIFDKSKYFVLVFHTNANIETRQVEQYRVVGDTAFISSGLKPNEKVIVKNQLLIYDALND